MASRRHTAGWSGVLVIDKPAGPASHDVVLAARRRRLAPRVGHAGTLDPFATGVLPLLLGGATRLSRFLTGSTKHYEATVRFGSATDTDDATGAETAAANVPDAAAVAAALPAFQGRIMQTPPAFSAKSIDGERAYKRARAGKPVAPAPVAVDVFELELLDYAPPEARIRVVCGAGTYIRALARDLGEACVSRAHCAALRRTQVGQFGLDRAVTLDALRDTPLEALAGALIPMRDLLPDWPAVQVSERGATAVRHGRLVPAREITAGADQLAAEWVRVVGPDGDLLALGSGAARFERPGDLHASLVLRP